MAEMLRSQNRQVRSVGNLGDILKHAAIVELGQALAGAFGPVLFVDTHAFLLHAPPSDPARWQREVDERLARFPAYARYAARERNALARTGRYRCSSGLALDALGTARAAASLGEANGLTRATLREQLREEGHADVELRDDAREALRDAPEGAGTALVHVDPFTLTPALWSDLSPALGALCARTTHVALVLYRYTRSAPSPWPSAPTGTLGPVAETRGGPHELAAYASLGLRDLVEGVCVSLGWRPHAR